MAVPVLTAIFAAFAIVLLAAILYTRMKRPSNYPPGPPRWPLIGGIFHLNFREPLARQFMAMAKKYGKVFSIKMGEYDAVVLTDLEDMKKVLVLEEAAGRWRFYQWLHLYFTKNVGLLFCDGAMWKANRRFCMRTMRDFGFGKSSMEVLIKDEIRELVGVLAKEGRKKGSEAAFETELGPRLVVTVINALWVMAASKRIADDDEEFKKVFDSLLVQFDNLTFLSMMPSLIPLLPKSLSGVKKHDEIRSLLFGYIQREVEEHKATLDPASPRDLTDKFLIEQKKFTGEEAGNIFTDLNVMATLLDLLGAGSETTSTALKWTFLYLINFPDLQERVFSEIQSVVGHDRTPSWDDSSSMHYTQAFIHEILRYITIAPLGVDHSLLEDVQLGNYHLPKGTVLLCVLHAVHLSPNHWKEPNTFNPGRFLDDQGCFFKHPAMVPFEIGKRQCLGESLARMTIFLTVAHLVQAFKFEKVPGFDYKLQPMPDSQIINSPFPYKVRVIPRDVSRTAAVGN